MEKRMANIKDLLRYKTSVDLKDKQGEILKTVWVRVINDEDLNKASRYARIASTISRGNLRNPETDEYKDQILPLVHLDVDILKSMILGSRQNQIMQEAYVKINKEELPKIEEFASEPDAPALEEQEELDKAVDAQQKDYESKIDQYINDRVGLLRSELEILPQDELIKQAQLEMSNVLPLQTFFDEFNAQKLFRGTYEDKLCKVPSFNSIEDVKETDIFIRDQILEAYTKIEISPTEIKNS